MFWQVVEDEILDHHVHAGHARLPTVSSPRPLLHGPLNALHHVRHRKRREDHVDLDRPIVPHDHALDLAARVVRGRLNPVTRRQACDARCLHGAGRYRAGEPGSLDR